jgi:hypothetical protein
MMPPAEVNTPPAFLAAGNLILNALEDALGIFSPDGRAASLNAVLKVLDYYCLPKNMKETSNAN